MRRPKWAGRWLGRRGQSLTELALFLPLSLLLIAGLAELGFALAGYMALQDATREAARFGADGDPCNGADVRDPANTCDSNPTFHLDFYQQITTLFDQTFHPYRLDPALGDDLVISAFGIQSDGTLAWRLPRNRPYGWSRYGNRTSRFSDATVQARMGHPPSKGVLIVEVYYHHRHRLGLFRWLLPDPIPMYAVSTMPLPAAEPVTLP